VDPAEAAVAHDQNLIAPTTLGHHRSDERIEIRMHCRTLRKPCEDGRGIPTQIRGREDEDTIGRLGRGGKLAIVDTQTHGV
jgi:hypothetical protein